MVRLLRNRNNVVPWKWQAKWSRALNYLSNIRYYVSHIYREVNHVADRLAAHAVNLEDIVW